MREGRRRRGSDGTHRVGVLDLAADVEPIPADGGDDGAGLDHGVALVLGQELVVALHDAPEAGTHEVHVLGVHDVAVGVLVLGPQHAVLNHGVRVEAHGLERGQGAAAEGGVRVAVGVRARGPGPRVGRAVRRVGQPSRSDARSVCRHDHLMAGQARAARGGTRGGEEAEEARGESPVRRPETPSEQGESREPSGSSPSRRLRVGCWPDSCWC